MNGDEVTASRADANDFEPASPSTAVSILTKTSFRAGHVTQKFDSNGLSDLFVTSPGENSDAGTLYRIDRATGDVTAINASLNDSTEEGPWVAGITSDGSFLYIYDNAGSIDRYDFDGNKETDNHITGVESSGFAGTSQLMYQNGFIFIATSGIEPQVAPVTGGAASTLEGTFGEEISGIWASYNRLFTADSGPDPGLVRACNLSFDGPLPVASNLVIEGTESVSGGFLGGMTVDFVEQKIYVGSAGSFGSEFPGNVLVYDIDGDVENHDDTVDFLNVIDGLQNGGTVGAYRISSAITGDLDCDGDIDFDDIDDFVSGLNNAAQYLSSFGVPPALKGDTDADGDLDFDDITGFVNLLTGGDGQAVPEPSTSALLGCASVLAMLCWQFFRRPRF